MYIRIAALLCLAVVSVTSSRHDIHKRMTPDEVQDVFQTTHENVPDYKLVRLEVKEPVRMEANQETKVKLVTFDNHVSLLLKPVDGHLVDEGTRVTIATGSYGRVTYRDDKSIMPRVGKLLRDEATKSSVILSQNKKRAYSLEGYIGSENLVLKALPTRFSNTLSRKVRSANGTLSSSNSIPHVLYRPMESVSIENKEEFSRINRTLSKMLKSRDKRSLEMTVYPELLLVVDDTSYRLHGSDPVRVVRYVICLWNSIDMLYRELKNPALRINIARIVIGTNAQATPYITKRTSGDTTRSYDVLTDAGKYFYEQQDQFPVNTYDVIMMMTANTLINSNGNQIMGVANVAAVCKKGYDSVVATGIFQSPGDYIELTPAHELGHLFGLGHDGTTPCILDDQYIMTPVTSADKNNWDFSLCSSKAAANEIRKLECLYNKPKNNGRPLRPILPGQILSREEQCQKTFGSKASAYDTHDCVGLKCFEDVNTRAYTILPGVAEGTPCAEGVGFCLKGECIEYPKDRAAYGLI